MKVRYTDEALNDLEAIANWLGIHYPKLHRPWNGASYCRGAHRALAGKRSSLS